MIFRTPYSKAKWHIHKADFTSKIGLLQEVTMETPDQNFEQKQLHTTGWELISESQGFGYASCVQYVS
jgi:hypothetical protein